MNSKIKSLFIEQFKGFKDFNINFESDINLIIGENGTGKTTIFEIIFNGLTGNKNYFNDDNVSKIQITIQDDAYEHTITILNNNSNISIIVDNKETTESDEFFNKQRVVYFPADVSYIDYSINGPSKMENENNNIKLDSETLSKDLKQYLVNAKFLDLNDREENREGNRIEHLKSIFNNFFDDKDFINIDVKTFEPIFKLKETGEIIKLSKLSLGEKQIFYKGCFLVQYSNDKNLIVLIDEPETSLHPEWQQKILNFYKNINPNNQYIFATHSPLIVSCCNKEKNKVIYKDNGQLKLKEELSETYGETNENLLYNVFELDTDRNIDIQTEINRYLDLYSRRDFITNDELEELKALKEKLLSIKSLPKDFVPLLELDINTKRLSQI